MKITCIAVGKIKEKYYTEAVKEYARRLSRYCKLDIIELPDEKTPDGAGMAEEAAILKREGERILKAVREDAYVIALAIKGRALDSVEFSHDLSPSADACNFTGAGVSELPHYERGAVS